MRARILGVAAVVASVALLAACGSSSNSPGASSPKTSAQTSSSSSQSPSSSPTPSTPPRDLNPQLLTVADLPAGWSVSHSTSSGGGATPPCIKALKVRFHSSSKAEASFVKGTDVPILNEVIGYFGTAAATAAVFNAGVAALNACTTMSFKADGYTYSGSIGAMSFPHLGDQSSAWQLTLTSQGYTFGFDVVVARKGPELALVLYGDLGTPNLDDVTALVTKAVAKMPVH